MNDLAAASQLSLIVLFFVFVLLGSKPWIHRTQRFSLQTLGNISGKKLSWQMTVLVWLSCAIPIAIGFAISVITLFSKLKLNKKTWGNPEAWIIGEQTVSLSLIAFCTACLLLLLIGFEVKFQ